MLRTGTILLTAAAALLAGLAAGSEAAAPAGAGAAGAAPAKGRAIVDVAVPRLPPGRGRAAEGRWRRARAEVNDLLGALKRRRGLEVAQRIPETGQLAVELEGESVAELRARLARDPRVLSVRRDRPVALRYAPNDPAFNTPDPHAPGGDFGQWNLSSSLAPWAWDASRGTGAEVAVIDTGADVTHPDLASRIVGTLDCSPNCGGTGVADAAGHGTHVAGLACGDSDNGYGIASLGFDCGLFVARVTLCSSVTQAIVAAANRGADAINLSLGDCASDVGQGIDYAWARGSVPVAAGTNSPSPGGNNYPAQRVQPEGSGPDLGSGQGLVVTAAQHSGARAAFAQASAGVSVAAFGAASDALSGGRQGILSSWPAAATTLDTGAGPGAPCNCRTAIGGDDRFAYLVGTSMAAPQVAGLVALMRSVNPALQAPQLVRFVKLTASNCGSYGGGIGWGLIDARRAVAAAAGRDVTPPASSVTRAERKGLTLERSSPECSAELPSAAVRTVNVFVSADGSPYRRLAKTSGERVRFRVKTRGRKKTGRKKARRNQARGKKTIRFAPKRGRRYSFYAVAVDQAGNREAVPAEADVTLRLKPEKKAKAKAKAKR